MKKEKNLGFKDEVKDKRLTLADSIIKELENEINSIGSDLSSVKDELIDKKSKTKRKRKSSHYIDNNILLNELIKYKKEKSIAIKEKTSIPKVPEYIGSCILKIAEKLASRPNFAGYTWKSDMIGDGIENCLMYLDNFDPRVSKNPFSYFTQIIYYAFLRRIEREKKQSYVKMKIFEQSDSSGKYKDWICKQYGLDADTVMYDFFKLNESDIDNFEKKTNKKKIKKSKKIKNNNSLFEE